MMSEIKCCICGNDLENKWGNNPDPVLKRGRCCSDCNSRFILDARMTGKDFSFEKKHNVIYTIDKLKEMFLNKEIETGLYTSVNEDGCDIVLVVQEGIGFDMHTNQKNGWIRCDSFDYDYEDKTWTQGESYLGRWKENGE